VDLCEFQANLVYRASSRTARATQRNPVSEDQEEEEEEEGDEKEEKVEEEEDNVGILGRVYRSVFVKSVTSHYQGHSTDLAG
jgi:ribosomal protein L12E/L44/L45/RPP1/RPP2